MTIYKTILLISVYCRLNIKGRIFECVLFKEESIDATNNVA